VVDIPTDTARVYSAVKTAKESLGADSAHTIACWPMGKVGEKVYYLSALVSALQSYTDANNDDVPYRSPSNQSLGITELCLTDGTEVLLDQDQANTVNSYGVVTALNMNGFKAWGNNTAAYPGSTDPKDRWIPCRRMFTWWGNTLIQTYFQKVDSPMNRRLIENVVDSENIRGNSFVARGYVAGASVEFNDLDNPATDLLNGIIRFKVNLAPYVPAENIEFKLEFDTNALTSSIVGGE
jgi:phage tail sheath protein FI